MFLLPLAKGGGEGFLKVYFKPQNWYEYFNFISFDEWSIPLRKEVNSRIRGIRGKGNFLNQVFAYLFFKQILRGR